jgi:molybdopterin molybdotransferase
VLTPAEADRLIGQHLQCLPIESLPLAQCAGAVLRENIYAERDQPPFDRVAMDGVALDSRSVAAGTRTFQVQAIQAAGDAPLALGSAAACIEVMTGAVLPDGCDSVVPVENLTQAHGTASLAPQLRVEPGQNVHRRGSDTRQGTLLVSAGRTLHAPEIAIAASAGMARIRVSSQPMLVVISTGNELVEPGTELIPGQIWESNATMLAAAAREAGCPARRHPIVRDDTEAVLAAIRDAIADADLLITTGGVSMVGEHDVVKAALATLGTVTFRKVAMQPGMPQGFGTVGPAGTPIFTLPGNPVSAYVSFCLFVRPALDALQDSEQQKSQQQDSKRERGKPAQAVLTEPVRSPAGKRSFLRGTFMRRELDRPIGLVTPVSGQASHQLASLAKANALVLVPEQVTSLDAGETVDVLELP